MIFALLLLILFIIMPLAVNRGLFKRVLLLAIGLELLKYLLRFASGYFLSGLDCSGACFILAIFAFTAMLPEMIIGHVHEPLSLWQGVAMFSAGVIWNLIPAYLIFLCLPGRPDLKKPIPTVSI
jgi:hypothetical protein